MRLAVGNLLILAEVGTSADPVYGPMPDGDAAEPFVREVSGIKLNIGDLFAARQRCNRTLVGLKTDDLVFREDFEKCPVCPDVRRKPVPRAVS